MHKRKLKKGALAGLAVLAALVIGLIFFLNRPKNADEAETAAPDAAAETAPSETAPSEMASGEETPAAEAQESTAPIQLTDKGEVVIELDEDEETTGE